MGYSHDLSLANMQAPLTLAIIWFMQTSHYHVSFYCRSPQAKEQNPQGMASTSMWLLTLLQTMRLQWMAMYQSTLQQQATRSQALVMLQKATALQLDDGSCQGRQH